jgi:hypothetical protein
LLSQAAKKRGAQQKDNISGSPTKRRSRGGMRPFSSEGPTTVIVRLLYEHREGMTVYEMQTRNGIAIKPALVRKIAGRLLASGYAKRERQKIILIEAGRKLWEASPLFLHTQRSGAEQHEPGLKGAAMRRS